MIDVSSAQSSAVLLAVVVIGVAQWLKVKLNLEDGPAEVMSFIVGEIGGALWFAAWRFDLVDVSNTAQLALGLFVSVLAFGLVPSGLYKFTMSVADRASGSD